jgi:hypothetical protein
VIERICSGHFWFWESPFGGEGIGGVLRVGDRSAAFVSQVGVGEFVGDDPSDERDWAAFDGSFDDDGAAGFSVAGESNGDLEDDVGAGVVIVDCEFRVVKEIGADFGGEVFDYGCDVGFD